MISKRIIEEIVEITADVIGIDKSLMTRKCLRDPSGKLHQFRSVVCCILMYDLNIQATTVYNVLKITPSRLSRNLGKVVADDNYIEQVRRHIYTHGLLNPSRIKQFDFSDPNNYESVNKINNANNSIDKNN